MCVVKYRPKQAKQLSGFTLLELLITITIFALIILMATPSFKTFLQNRKIRNTAESILSGMQIARAEAVKSNINHEFQINIGAGTWAIYRLDPATPPDTNITRTLVRDLDFEQLWSGVNIQTVFEGSNSANNTVSFDGVGRLLATNNNSGGAPIPTLNPFTQVNVSITTTATNIYPMWVEADPAARGIRVCMPHLAPGDPKACTP